MTASRPRLSCCKAKNSLCNAARSRLNVCKAINPLCDAARVQKKSATALQLTCPAPNRTSEVKTKGRSSAPSFIYFTGHSRVLWKFAALRRARLSRIHAAEDR